jgi:hypothetical protein
MPVFLPRYVIDMTTKLIARFGTIIRVHLQPSKGSQGIPYGPLDNKINQKKKFTYGKRQI